VLTHCTARTPDQATAALNMRLAHEAKGNQRCRVERQIDVRLCVRSVLNVGNLQCTRKR